MTTLDPRPADGASVAATAHGPSPRLLCLDTTTERMALALTDGVVTHTLEEAGGALASARLLPAVNELMQRSGWALGQLHAVAFARGPGAFTGLRTAAAVAQGLALGLNIPALPVDSLMIVAQDHRLAVALHAGLSPAPTQAAMEVWVAMDARMGEIYAATYRHNSTDTTEGTAWQVLRPPALMSAAAWLMAWHDAAAAPASQASQAAPDVHRAVVGTAWPLHGLQDAIGSHVPTRAHTADRATALARLAWQAHRDGLHVDAALAWPSYVRDQVALTTAERVAQAASLASASLPAAPARPAP
jgi:tRNA threonylcarbamoyladenosine biosynthesis protein TsaB